MSIQTNDEIFNIPSWDEYFMRMVYLVATRSKDPRTKIGAVLVKDKRIISAGFNGLPIGVNDDYERYSNRELKNQMIIHAEDNAILSASRFGILTIDSIIYLQGLPCRTCAQSIIQGGIKKIVIHTQWPNLYYSPEWVKSIELSKIMLNEAGIKIKEFGMILNVQGYLDGKVIMV